MQTTIINLLAAMAKELCGYLEKNLPTIKDDWWNTLVIPFLSYQQQQFVKQKRITTLFGLDLAALLRIIDQNWHNISQQKNFPHEARNYLKEMQTIRNRWAHAGSDDFDKDDVYRDLDTLQRFAAVIEAGEEFINSIKEAKNTLLPGNIQQDFCMSERQQSALSETAEFQKGQVVAPRADPSIRGAVIDILPGETENRFSVFVDGATATYYASQLQLAEEKQSTEEIVPLSEFHAYLTALQIRHPGISTLYSLNAAKVDFIPYQFRPVLKFIRSDRPRLLIADGVGVGKTIEAGFILRELQARRDIQSVLIICPKPLVTEQKWLREMKRFDEQFTQLDGKTLQLCIHETHLDGIWPGQHAKTILPYSLLSENTVLGDDSQRRRNWRRGLLDLDPPPRFDLVIVDEAHHVRNTDTFSYRGVRFFCEHAEAVVFLTATPIQLRSKDLFVLLQLLRPDLIIDQTSFEHMAEPNAFINETIDIIRSQAEQWQPRAQEALAQTLSTAWGRSILRGNPDFEHIRATLSRDDISAEERIALVHALEQTHTFAGMINRTRRRDIGEFTVRTPETVPVEFTPQQRMLHDSILRIQAEVYTRLHGERSVNFLMSTIRRQAASCLFGLVPLLQEILTRHLDDLLWDEIDVLYDPASENSVNDIESQILEVLELAERLESDDPKLNALCKIIEEKQHIPNNKIMLFSSFRHTLRYLLQQLQQQDYRVELIHGGTPDEERVALRSRFQAPRESDRALDILLFSEVGCEGLDYQFCDCMVNYDLPWNPMRVEQRIGRIDRYGQASEKVVIYNLVTPGTVDADIYERCLMRIGVFNRELGGSEEILGNITREIHSVAENLQLTEEERRAKLQQIADNNIRLIQEQETLEEKQVELFGIRIPSEQFTQEIKDVSSYWLSPDALRNLAANYLEKIGQTRHEVILGEKPLKTLRLSQEARKRLLEDFLKIPRQRSPIFREWEKWLKGGEPHLPITFDANCASEDPKAAFIMPLHPLVRQAAMSYTIQRRILTACAVTDETLPPGDYPFAIYQWQYRGIRDDLELRGIGENQEITAKLISLLEKGTPLNFSPADLPKLEVFDRLESQQYEQWRTAKADHLSRTTRVAEYKRESLTTSHQARMALLNEQLSQATNKNIRRMKHAQIANAEADYTRHFEELKQATAKADIETQPVAFGIIRVTNEGGTGAK